MKLSVIIVNYNVKYFLYQCLDSVFRASKGIDTEVYVVDNNSTDGSIEYLRSLFPQVTYIENKQNVGFSRANNQAIRLSSGEYVLLLNPDTIVGEDVFSELISFFDNNKDAGAAGVRMLNQNGTFALESRRGIPSPLTSLCKMTGLCKMFPKNKTLGHYYMQYLDANKISEIEIMSGACMFIRRSALDKSGLLDEQFFMYGEDIDLSYRLHLTGMKNYYLPVNILHYKGESTHKGSYKYVNAFYSAMLIFFKKHYGEYNILLSLPIKLAIYAKATIDYIFQSIKKLEKQHGDLYYMRRKKYMLLGSEENKAKMRDICGKHGLNITDNPESANYIIFDVSSYSYKDMLEYLRTAKISQAKPLIATYHPTLGNIITGSVIL